MNFKIIKSKVFTFTDDKKVEQKGTSYTVAHKGRVMNVSTLNFEEGDITTKDGILSIKGDVDAVKSTYLNSDMETVVGVKLMPKMDLVLADF